MNKLRLFQVAATLLIVALAACDTSPISSMDKVLPTHEFLYPKDMAARFQVGDVVTLRNERRGGDFPLVFVERPDGRYLFASNKTLWLYEPTGTLVWRKTIFEQTFCRFPIVEEDLIFICRTPDDQQQIIRTDLDGEHLSTVLFQTGQTSGWIQRMRDRGGFLFERVLGDPDNTWTLSRFGADGQKQWARVYDGVDVKGMTEAAEGGFLLAGDVLRSRSPEPGVVPKAVLLALDGQGREVWRKTFDVCPLDCSLSEARLLNDGRFLVGGTRQVRNAENAWELFLWLVMVDAQGNVRWELTEPAEDIGGFDFSLLEESAEGFEMIVRLETHRRGTIKISADGRLVNRYVWPFAFPSRSGPGLCSLIKLQKRTEQALGAMLSCDDLDGGSALGLYNGQIWMEALVLD